jgi:hypothetical protein
MRQPDGVAERRPVFSFPEVDMSEIYVVIGAPRSGTSLTAGILHALGVPMFPSVSRAVNGNAGDDWNQGGHFADADFYSLVSPRLPGLSLPDPQWQPDGDAIGLIADMIAARAAFPKWGFKGLHAWIGAAVLQQMGHAVRVLNTSRPLADSQASYLARVGPMYQEAGAAWIADCKNQSDAFYQSFRGPKMTVDFLSVIASPVYHVSLIAASVGVKVTQEALDFVNADWVRFS